VRTERQNVRPYCIIQFDKLLHDVSYGGTNSANSLPFGDWGAEEKGTEKGKGRLVKERVGSRSSHLLGRRSICGNVYRRTDNFSLIYQTLKFFGFCTDDHSCLVRFLTF